MVCRTLHGQRAGRQASQQCLAAGWVQCWKAARVGGGGRTALLGERQPAVRQARLRSADQHPAVRNHTRSRGSLQRGRFRASLPARAAPSRIVWRITATLPPPFRPTRLASSAQQRGHETAAEAVRLQQGSWMQLKKHACITHEESWHLLLQLCGTLAVPLPSHITLEHLPCSSCAAAAAKSDASIGCAPIQPCGLPLSAPSK